MVYITLPLLRERRNGALHSEPFTLYIEKMRYLYYFDNKDRQMPAFLKKKKKKIECCLQSEHILWRYRTKQKNRGALLSAPRLLNKISFIFSLLDRNGALHNEPFHMFMKSITLLLCKDSKAGTTSRKKNTEKKNSVYIQNILLVV